MTFDFLPSTGVYFGAGRLQEVGELVRQYGGRRVLLVSDPGIVAAGHVDLAHQSISNADCEAFLFDGVAENPTTDHVENGVTFANEKQIDIIVALGGGSAMDCAKGINFLLTNGGSMHDYWGKNKAGKPMLPSIGVPTTAGTGSEAQSFALISDPITHVKMACGDIKARFRAVILDPKLLASVPQEVAAVTAMDAVTHALESYVTAARNPVSQLFSAEAWRLINDNFEQVMHGRQNVEACGKLMLGANFAGMAIENAMLGAAHACANPLTARYGITHGIAVGLIMPHVIHFNREVCKENYARLASIAGINHNGNVVQSLIGRVAAMRTIANLPATLRQVDVPEQDLPGLAAEAAGQWTGTFNPRSFDEAAALEIYRQAF